MKTIIEMAREVGFAVNVNNDPNSARFKALDALVRADEREAEREACAKVCDKLNFIDNGTPAGTRATNRHCAAAIRARGLPPTQGGNE